MTIVPARWAGLGLLAGLVAELCLASGQMPPVTTAQLLVDLARDHALLRAGKQTDADVLQVKTLLRAAVRLDPKLVDAHAWLYELAMLADDREEAATVLERLVAADPSHQGAFQRWLDAGIVTRQTVETRQQWLQQTLTSVVRPAELQAMIHVAIARLAVDAMDPGRARVALDRALGLDRGNPDAAMLDMELLAGDGPAAARLRVALRALQANPLQAEVAWQIGALLDEIGRAADARPFYEHALEVHAIRNPGGAIPATHLMQLACSLLVSGENDAAVARARGAVEADPESVEARMFCVWLLRRSGREVDADDIRRQLAARFDAIRDPSQATPIEVARAAWYHCLIDPQPQRALMLAEAAAARMGGDAFATRALGWAQAINERREEAGRTLVPLAGKDAYAAYQLARMAREAGDEPGAIRVIENLAFVPPAGPAADLIGSLQIPRPAATVGEAARAEIAGLLAGFDRDTLDFHKGPNEHVEARIALLDPAPGPGEAWWAELSLTNRAKFPITLGTDWMLNPVFMLSFHVEGDRERDYPFLMTFNLDNKRVLRPGETIAVRRTLDVGPLRRVVRGTPQQLQRVSIRAIVDPVQEENGKWRPAATGQELRPVYFSRVPARAGAAEMGGLFSSLGSPVNSERFRAIEVLAELLGERQRAETTKLSYVPEKTPGDRMYQALLAGLRSDSWEVRARTLESLQVVGLDAEMLSAVQKCLGHEHWCVRLMALRLIARQGAAKLGAVRQIAEGDADELVREMARSYVKMWEPASATSQPAGGGP